MKRKQQLKQNKKNNQEKHAHIYIGFTSRLIFNIIIFLSFITLGTFLLNNSLKFENQKIIKYNELSNLDYKVYLLKNEFYEEPYLEKDMLYVASLINKIQLDFDYTLKTEDKESLDFTYSIIGKLTITNKEATKSYFEKTYTLLEQKNTTMKNTNVQNIKETLDINYAYYNQLANNFKSSYGIDTESNLTVYMIINKKNNEESNFKMDSSSIMNVTIPLSERAINIELDYKDIDETSTIVEEQGIAIENIISLIISLILITISIIIMIKIMRKISLLKTKRSRYDKYIEKILKEYDRLVAETTTLMSFDDKEIIKVNKFTELLDIHDNLQLPIMYYSITKHQKSYFYINHNKTIYLLIIKASDLETTKNDK